MALLYATQGQTVLNLINFAHISFARGELFIFISIYRRFFRWKCVSKRDKMAMGFCRRRQDRGVARKDPYTARQQQVKVYCSGFYAKIISKTEREKKNAYTFVKKDNLFAIINLKLVLCARRACVLKGGDIHNSRNILGNISYIFYTRSNNEFIFRIWRMKLIRLFGRAVIDLSRFFDCSFLFIYWPAGERLRKIVSN